MRLDEKDLVLLDILSENAKLTTSQISKRVKMPITTVHNRIKRLEQNGIITRYTVVVNHKLLGKEVLVYVWLNLNYNIVGKKVTESDIAQQIKKYPFVEEANITTGDQDIIVKARFASLDEVNEFVTKTLRRIEGIDKTKTIVILQEF